MSERTARLDELLREEISAIIGREIADPRIGFVTVTRCRRGARPGPRHGLGVRHRDARTRRASVRALGRAMPFVRDRLGALRLKRIPELHVREDDTAARGTRLLHILDELEHGGQADDVAAEPPRDLPVPVPVRGIPEPRPRRRRHRSGGEGTRGH